MTGCKYAVFSVLSSSASKNAKINGTKIIEETNPSEFRAAKITFFRVLKTMIVVLSSQEFTRFICLI